MEEIVVAWVAAGRVAGALTPVIDRSYPLQDVPEALRYLTAAAENGTKMDHAYTTNQGTSC